MTIICEMAHAIGLEPFGLRFTAEELMVEISTWF
jgi:hypothetical protein